MATATAPRRGKKASAAAGRIVANKFRVYIPGLDKPGSQPAAPVCLVEYLPDVGQCRVTWEPNEFFWPAGSEPAHVNQTTIDKDGKEVTVTLHGQPLLVDGGPGEACAKAAYNAANGINNHDKPHVCVPVREGESVPAADSDDGDAGDGIEAA